ncbi:MAG: CSLREA domain-containing protein [Nitrospirae bacterium]|nr:CSLREA domain-containing protein [Nitrospirota bacterium]
MRWTGQEKMRAIIYVIVLAGAMAMPSASFAAKFVVNSTDDIVDAAPGDGICETGAGNRVCTLRAAVQEANALAGPDKIVLKAKKYSLIAGNEGESGGAGEDAAATGDLDISESVTIIGQGAAYTVVDGSHLDRVFHISGTAADIIRFSGITVQNGSVIGQGGGIFNDSDSAVTITSCSIRDNLAYGTAGGGIASSGPLTIVSSVIARNALYFGMSGISALGGGVAVTGPNATLTVTGSKIANNSVSAVVEPAIGESGSAWGGGIGADGANTIMIGSSRVLNNTADSWSPSLLASSGGGLFISGSTNPATVTESSIANNAALGSAANGGGIAVIGTTSTFSGCTIKGNAANGFSAAQGGGIYLQGDALMTVGISGLSKVIGNYAASSGGGIFTSGAIALNIAETATVANNTPDDMVP